MISILDSTPTQVNDILSEDLSLTTALLKQHPKIYAIWNHRQWCLHQVPDGPSESDINEWRQSYWNKELFVVEKMLDADSRNCEPSLVSDVISSLDNYPSSRLELSSLRIGFNASESP